MIFLIFREKRLTSKIYLTPQSLTITFFTGLLFLHLFYMLELMDTDRHLPLKTLTTEQHVFENFCAPADPALSFLLEPLEETMGMELMPALQFQIGLLSQTNNAVDIPSFLVSFLPLQQLLNGEFFS
jgi:hypothetical protein